MDLEKIRFDKRGLIPCIAQDYRDGRVLMMAYMNRESLQETVSGGKACYWSRSRQKRWLKGEESGNVQHVKEIYIDCDMDTVLLKVEQVGDCACHKGFRSCFYRKLDDRQWQVIDKKIKDPSSMYGKS